MSDEPLLQLLGGPAAGRTFLPGTTRSPVIRVPIAQPLTLAEGSGGCRIARYVRSDIPSRPDLYLFHGYEDNLDEERATQARILISPLVVNSLISYALAAPTNDASREARDRIVRDARGALAVAETAIAALSGVLDEGVKR